MKKYKCKFCGEPATHAIRWAEGRAIVPCCAKHQAKARNNSKDVANDPSAKLVKLSQFELGFFEELGKISSAGSTGKVIEHPEIHEDKDIVTFSRTGTPDPPSPPKWTPGTYAGGSVLGKMRAGFTEN